VVLRGIQIGPSPEWVQKRLESCGIRSINNIVDCTNLIMLELGQPLHAFDLKKLQEERIVVRRARAGESLRTIDGDNRVLDSDMLAICDASRPTAVAGVMGGLDTEVSETTTDIFLESAFFHPPSIRRTAKKLGMKSEASYRLERGVDLETVILAANRCARLMTELAGAKMVGRIGIADTKNRQHLESLQGRSLTLKFEYCDRLLGQTIPPETIAAIFNSLQLTVIERTSESITVRVPSFRQDIVRPADLVEEIARCYGYNEFTPTLMKAPVKAPEAQAVDRQLIAQLRQYLVAEGLWETVTYSFTGMESLRAFPLGDADLNHPSVTVQNPLNVNESTMRSSLFPSLLQAVRRNAARGNADFGLFEIARHFIAQNDQLTEKRILAVAACGNPHKAWRDSKPELDFFDVKGLAEAILQIAGVRRYRLLSGPDCLHPKRGVAIQVGKAAIGFFGELHPTLVESYELAGRVPILELDLTALTEAFRSYQPAYRSFSAFPPVNRDLALLVPQGVQSGKIEDIIRQESGELLEDLLLFDYYRGKQVVEGRVSAGFRLTLRSKQETLNEERVETLVGTILNRLQKELDVNLRS